MSIIITRPLENCADFPKEKNFVFLPLMEYASIDKIDIRVLKSSFYILTSKQAARFVLLKALSKDATYYCVGEKTAGLLRQKSYKNIIVPDQFCALNLIELIKKKHNKENSILYLSGEIISHDIDLILKKHSFICEKVVVYKTIPLEHDLHFLLKDNIAHKIVFYSQESYKLFIKSLKKNKMLKKANQWESIFIIPNGVKRFVLEEQNEINWKKNEILSDTKALLAYLKKVVK